MIDEPNTMTSQLIFRCPHELRIRMERIVKASRIGNISDHMRLALMEYTERHEEEYEDKTPRSLPDSGAGLKRQ
ncbi:MAG: hypothetical protein A2Z04_08805 [Chloroflexi bacterium RBG_16_57_9]|nr:MAG: hypothetical protein A2Z04_08805 [Chloroflexi bacterium RBG_16_57_9]